MFITAFSCYVLSVGHFTGAQYIKNILMETENLDFLHIGKNDIGNDGLRHITEGLKKNSTLTKLKAYDCGFSEEGILLST